MAKKKQENLKPMGWAWFIYRTYSIIKMKLSNNIKYDIEDFKNRNKKEGCIVLYNHCCNHDHYIATGMFKRTKANYVVTKRFNFYSAYRAVFKLVKAITRDQFKNDTSSILKMKRVIERGGVVCIAPAGQVSIHGKHPYINPIIVKLLKMCKADVYTIQTTGSYLSYPKWGKSKRKYPISVKCVKTLSKEEVKSLDIEACYEKILNHLDVCDRDYQRDAMIKIKGKDLSAGLENVLYICPKCGKKYTISTKDSLIICDNCQNTILYNQYGFLEGVGNDYVLMKDETLWFEYQKEVLMKQIKEHTYKKVSNVTLYSNTRKEFKLGVVGSGVLTFDVDNLYYDGTKDGEVIHKEFSLHSLYQLPFAPGVRFNIPDEEGMYEFVPENKKEVIEWVQAIDAYHTLKLIEAENEHNE